MRYPRSVFRELHAPRGTEVTLVVHANTPVKNGWLHVDWSGGKKEDIQGELMPADPNALRFAKILLDQGGMFRINFMSGTEENIDREPYKIVVFEHGKPLVKITKPEEGKIDMPPNGTLVVEGFANSSHPEIGIQNMTLRMKVRPKEGDKAIALESKPYRPAKSFKLVNGKYPPSLKYMDFVALDKLKTDKGVTFPLAKGMELEYWLEARDNTDYPEKNGAMGESLPHKWVTIVDPDTDKKKQEQARQQAKKEQEQHEKQQNQDFDKQNEQAKKEQDANKPPEQKNKEQLDKEKEKLNQDAKNIQDQANKGQEKNKEENKGEAKGQNGKQQDKGNSKAGNPDPKKNQQPQDARAKDNKQGQENAAQKKEGPKENQPDKGGEAKGPGQNDPNKNQGSQAKDSGQKNPESPQGSAKDEKNNGNQEKSAAKEQPKDQSGNAKDQGMNQSGDKTGQAKGPEDQKINPKDQAQDKQAGKEQPGAQAKDSKQPDGSADKSAQKGDTKKGPGPKDDKSQAKGKGKEPGNETKISEGKKGPVDMEKEGKGLAKGEDSVENQSGAKGGSSGEKGPPPMAKSPGAGKGPPPQTAKEPTPESKNAGEARGEKGPGKQPTVEDIAKLEKELAKKDPKIQEKAVDDLAKAARDAKDPKLRDAALKALEEANKGRNKAKGAEGSDPKTAKAEPKENGNQGEGQGQAKQGDNQDAGAGKGDPSPEDIANAKGGDKAGSFGPGAKGISDEDLQAKDPDNKLSKRGGDLNLENLREQIKKLSKMTQAEREKAGVTDKQLQDWQRWAQKYDDLLRKQQAQAGKNPDKSKGIGSVIKTFDPTKLGPALNPNVDPLNTGQFQAPPQFRDAQRQFTRPGTPEKK
jgi:hypothetical protein